MARSIEQVLASLRRIDPADPKSLALLRGALEGRAPNAGVVVAAAAQAIEEHGISDLTPELAESFTAMCVAKRDPGCRGRIAIAKALHAIDRWAPEVFEAGLTIVQLEGEPKPNPLDREDVAAPLRGMCAMAHAHFVRPDALDVCAAMLADDRPAARIGAARGLGDSGRIDATAVLRYKLVLASDDGEVLAACFDALFALRREGAIEFTRALLVQPDERSDAAALALGSNRATETLDDLIRWGERDSRRRREVGYLAITLLRCDAGNAHLGDAIATGSPADARAAVEALRTFRHEPAVAELLASAILKIKDKALRSELAG